MLRTSDLDYHLPLERVATHPAEPRDAARLMLVRRSDAAISHARVRDLTQILRPGDLLVLNRTRVVPARLVGVREDTGARVQGLYVAGAANHRPAGTPMIWQVLLKMRRFRENARVVLFTPDGSDSGWRLRLLRRADAISSPDAAPMSHPAASDLTVSSDPAAAGWLVRVEDKFGSPPDLPGLHVLDNVGRTPLPPYILAARRHHDSPPLPERSDRSERPTRTQGMELCAVAAGVPSDDPADRERYQTVYADAADAGSVAAPTAGLHFTPELLAALAARGVRTTSVVLHVGLGTFKPVETEFVEQHPMHSEWCRLPLAAAREIIDARRRAAANPGSSRVIAVGTTAARTLESFDDLESLTADTDRDTRLLITPGYRFRHLDGLLTNFHLPRSTLLAMVGALLHTPTTPGVPRLLGLYAQAIALDYRFYSFGDAMLILP